MQETSILIQSQKYCYLKRNRRLENCYQIVTELLFRFLNQENLNVLFHFLLSLLDFVLIKRY